MRFRLSASGLSASVLSGLAALMALPVAAQTYPSKPIRILIAQAPGSATDNVSRVLTAKLAGQMGQQFVIEARPGAGGAVGTEAAARSPGVVRLH